MGLLSVGTHAAQAEHASSGHASMSTPRIFPFTSVSSFPMNTSEANLFASDELARRSPCR